MSPAYGYTAYCCVQPPPDMLCRFWNEATGARFTCMARDLPVMDTRYLWHKITALGGDGAWTLTKHG